MPDVTLIVKAEVAQYLTAIAKVAESQNALAKGQMKIAEAAAATEKQAVGSYGRMDAALRKSMREFESRQRVGEAREERFIAPARLAGVDVTSLAAIQAVRSAKARELMFQRQGQRSNAFFSNSNAETAANEALRQASQQQFAEGYWAQKDREDVGRKAIDYNNFDLKVSQMEKAKQLARERRQKLVSGVTRVASTIGVAVYTAGRYYDHIAEKLDQVAVSGAQFDTEMRPLLSLGGNLKDIPGQRERVRSLSTGLGVDTAQSASSLFMLQSAAANLGPAGQKDILSGGTMLTQVAGGSLEVNLVAVTKLMQTYGKEMGNAQMAASKLLATQDQAAVTMEELSSLMPDVLPAAKLMGVGYDELAGSIITATQVMGKNEKTFTGIRNLFLQLPEAMQKGLVHKGPFLDMLRELKAASPEEMITTFGQKTVAVVAALADKSGEVAANFRTIRDVTESSGMDKFVLRMSDTVTFDAAVLKSAQEQIKNAEAIKFEDPQLRKPALAMKLAEAGYEMRDDPVSEMLDITGLGKKFNIAGQVAGGGGTDAAIAIADQIKKLRSLGDRASVFQANQLEVAYGKSLRLPGFDTEWGKRAGVESDWQKNLHDMLGGDKQHVGFGTDESDLPEFNRLSAMGYNLDSSKYSVYRQIQDKKGDAQAKAFLARYATTAQSQLDASGSMDAGQRSEFTKNLIGTKLAKLAGFNVDLEKFSAWRDVSSVAPDQASGMLGANPNLPSASSHKLQQAKAFAFTKDAIGAGLNVVGDAAWANIKHISQVPLRSKLIASGLDAAKAFGTQALAYGFDKGGSSPTSAADATSTAAGGTGEAHVLTKWDAVADKLDVTLDRVLAKLPPTYSSPFAPSNTPLPATKDASVHR